MSWTTIKAGLVTGWTAVSGIKRVLPYMPLAIQETPLLYVTLSSFERTYEAQVSKYTYRASGTLVIDWQDNGEAETALDALIESCAQAFDADMTLGGRLTSGAALVESGDLGWVDIGGQTYRVAIFPLAITEIAC